MQAYSFPNIALQRHADGLSASPDQVLLGMYEFLRISGSSKIYNSTASTSTAKILWNGTSLRLYRNPGVTSTHLSSDSLTVIHTYATTNVVVESWRMSSAFCASVPESSSTDHSIHHMTFFFKVDYSFNGRSRKWMKAHAETEHVDGSSARRREYIDVDGSMELDGVRWK